MYFCMCIHIYIYIYIFTERERERDREDGQASRSDRQTESKHDEGLSSVAEQWYRTGRRPETAAARKGGGRAGEQPRLQRKSTVTTGLFSASFRSTSERSRRSMRSRPNFSTRCGSMSAARSFRISSFGAVFREPS